MQMATLLYIIQASTILGKRGPKLTVVRHMPNPPALHRVLRQYLQECAKCFTYFVFYPKNHLTYIAC